MILYIIRHTWAVNRDDADGDDARRPLTEKGRQRFACLVEQLATRGFAPTCIASSPLVRCRQTAEILADHLSGQPKIVRLDALRPCSDLAETIAWTKKHRGHEQLAWVGHAPDVSEMAAALIGDLGAWIRFTKGAVAAIRFDGAIQAGQGVLLWHVTAKILGC